VSVLQGGAEAPGQSRETSVDPGAGQNQKYEGTLCTAEPTAKGGAH